MNYWQITFLGFALMMSIGVLYTLSSVGKKKLDDYEKIVCDEYLSFWDECDNKLHKTYESNKGKMVENIYQNEKIQLFLNKKVTKKKLEEIISIHLDQMREIKNDFSISFDFEDASRPHREKTKDAYIKIEKEKLARKWKKWVVLSGRGCLLSSGCLLVIIALIQGSILNVNGSFASLLDGGITCITLIIFIVAIILVVITTELYDLVSGG